MKLKSLLLIALCMVTINFTQDNNTHNTQENEIRNKTKNEIATENNNQN